MSIIDIDKIKTPRELENIAKKALVGKTLSQISKAIRSSDKESRITTKGHVGYVIEEGYFGIKKNNEGNPDIPRLGVEIKTCPLKYNTDRKWISVKEPLSLNIINYRKEAECRDITESALYKKNRRILFICYLHDKKANRSEYVVKHVFLWEMDKTVLDELRPDYKIIIDKIRAGIAHEIHQKDNQWLTLCPKHNGDFKDPKDTKSKTTQPYSSKPAEIRAFRLKSSYMNKVVSDAIGKKLEKGRWHK